MDPLSSTEVQSPTAPLAGVKTRRKEKRLTRWRIPCRRIRRPDRDSVTVDRHGRSRHPQSAQPAPTGGEVGVSRLNTDPLPGPLSSWPRSPPCRRQSTRCQSTVVHRGQLGNLRPVQHARRPAQSVSVVVIRRPDRDSVNRHESRTGHPQRRHSPRSAWQPAPVGCEIAGRDARGVRGPAAIPCARIVAPITIVSPSIDTLKPNWSSIYVQGQFCKVGGRRSCRARTRTRTRLFVTFVSPSSTRYRVVMSLATCAQPEARSPSA